MYTLHITWPGLDCYSIMDNEINPAAEYCNTVASNAFPGLQRNSHVVLLAVYRVCNQVSLMSLVMFPEG